MKRFVVVVVLALAVLAGAGGECRAAARDWQLDPAHCNFYFTIQHIFAHIRGRFADFSGTVHFDPADLEHSSMKFVIQTKSIDTGFARRDRDLRSRNFFDVADYPTMVFESVAITAAPDNLYNVRGKFTIKGKTYDLVLPLTLAGIKAHPAMHGKEVLGLNGETYA